jgi:hypothetical protein
MDSCKPANCFLMFMLQENPFQRAARRQNRSGSVSSSSTVGDSSNSSTGSTSNSALPSTSQEHTAVAVGGIPCFFFCLTLCSLLCFVFVYIKITL